jgi:hypothetical protein
MDEELHMSQNTDTQSTYNITNAAGNPVEVPLGLEDYRAASAAGLSLSQYVNRKVDNYDASRGTPFEQMCASAGMFVRRDSKVGIHPPTMKEVLDGSAQMNVGTIVRPDGSGNNTPSGRLLYPEVIMQIMASELTEDKSDFVNGYNSMVAQTQTVTSAKIEQPIIDTTEPEKDEYASQPISQLAEPPAIVTITVSDTSRRIPTHAVGLTISDEALQATTLDLVGLAMTHQARAERIRVIERNINAMVNGDVDAGETALSSATTTSFDSAATGGIITQKAWIKYLRANFRKMSISHIMMDIDTALKLEGRTGKPVVVGDDPTSPRMDALFSIENLGISAPKVLLMDTAVVGADTLVGLDSRYAIRRVINVSATYSAIEQYVMRKAHGLRLDTGELSHKLFTDAWSVMTVA